MLKDKLQKKVKKANEQPLQRNIDRQKTKASSSKNYIEEIYNMLRLGIRVEKYHYSKKGSKVCTLRLSNDYRKLIWFYDDQKLSSQLMDRQIKIENIESVIFGPQAFTFKSYKSQHLVDKLERAISNHENMMANPGQTLRMDTVDPKFYAWECMSLKTAERTIDFVILDESVMIKFMQGIHLLVQILSKSYQKMIKHHKTKEYWTGEHVEESGEQ